MIIFECVNERCELRDNCMVYHNRQQMTKGDIHITVEPPTPVEALACEYYKSKEML